MLFPVFLKIEQLNTVIIGGGNVGLEKLQALLKNSPEAQVTLIGTQILDEIKLLATKNKSIKVMEKPFQKRDLKGAQILIVATDNHRLNEDIARYAGERGILTNVADTPALCDFYLGSTVTKGSLKIGISTNGLSPTFAKRFRQVLEDILPEETQELLLNLNHIRNKLKTSFTEKVKRLNEHTKSLVHD